MVGKEVTIYTKNGLIEPVICWDFKIGMDNGVAALLCRMATNKMYVVPLEKINHFDVAHVWIFDEWTPPPMPDAPVV